jgi:hypothetical protein
MKIVFCWRLEGHGRKKQDPEPDPDPLVRGKDPRILIRTKMSRINNTGTHSIIVNPERSSIFKLPCTKYTLKKLTKSMRKAYKVLRHNEGIHIWLFI